MSDFFSNKASRRQTQRPRAFRWAPWHRCVSSSLRNVTFALRPGKYCIFHSLDPHHIIHQNGIRTYMYINSKRLNNLKFDTRTNFLLWDLFYHNLRTALQKSACLDLSRHLDISMSCNIDTCDIEMYTCTCIYIYIYLRIYIHIHIYICLYVYIDVPLYQYMYMYIYI